MAAIDFSGIIPPAVSNEIIAVATEESAVLSLGRRVPMPSGVTEMPIQTGVPVAGWVTQAGGRKPFTDLSVDMQTMHAEEIAAVVAIPQAYLDDSAIALWSFVQPQLASAIAVALDNAVLFGTNKPPTFPVGGITSATYCQDAVFVAGDDAATIVNNAMGAVETQGLPVTGHIADMQDQAVLRNIRDNSGAFLLGPTVGTAAGVQSFWGLPIYWDQFPAATTSDFITGYWTALQIGVRQDISYAVSDTAVIADGTGNVIISAFQDNTVVMKAEARFGMLVTNPPTQKYPDGAKPFAKTALVTGGVPAVTSSRTEAPQEAQTSPRETQSTKRAATK